MTRAGRRFPALIVLACLAWPQVAAARAGAKWDVPVASPVWSTWTTLLAGRTYTFTATSDLSIGDPGGSATMHLWDAEAEQEVIHAGPSELEIRVEPDGSVSYYRMHTSLTYTVPSGKSGYYWLMVRATYSVTPGVADIVVPDEDGGPDRERRFFGVPFGGAIVDLEVGASGARGAVLGTAFVPGGCTDTVLYLLDGGRLVALDRDGGVGRASRLVIPNSSLDLTAVVASGSAPVTGATTLLLNDAPLAGHDADRDGVGHELEEAIGTCPYRAFEAPPRWDCTMIPDIADTDEDGLREDAEIFGGFETYNADGTVREPAVELPAWGASPRHKDVFVETDWCLDGGPVPGQPSPPTCASPTDDRDDTRMTQPGAAGAAAWFEPVAGSRGGPPNPDAVPGVNVHFDTGRDDPLCGTTCGDWGGAQCVSLVPDPAAPGQHICPDWPDLYPSAMASNRRGMFHHAFVPGGQAYTNDVRFGAARDDGNTTAHELGHNLSLEHWGDSRGDLVPIRGRINCKPNYQSLMNYAYSFAGFGYSDGALRDPPLDKEAVVESRGMGTTDPLRLARMFQDFRFSYAPTGDIDWNRDGNYASGPVAAPFNWMRASCGTFAVGRQRVAAQVDATPAIVHFGGYYYVFFVKWGRLWYSRASSLPEECDGRLHDATACAAWLAPGFGGVEVTFEDGSHPGRVTSVAADVMDLEVAGLGRPLEPHLVVTYHGPDTGAEIRWLTLREAPPTGSAERFHPEGVAAVLRFAPPGVRPDLELEEFQGALYLAYPDVAPVCLAKLDPRFGWMSLGELRDELGLPITILRQTAGVGLAANEARGEMWMAAAEQDALDPSCHMIEIYHVNPATGQCDRLHNVPTVAPDRLCTTTKPALIFKPDPNHAYGGWYMLLFREKPLNPTWPLWWSVPGVRMTDRRGHFDPGIPTSDVVDEWTPFPDDAVSSLNWWRMDDGRVLGAYILRGIDDDPISDLVVLPRADGIARTEARDNDDRETIRAGLCVSLRSVVAGLKCEPAGHPPLPAPSRLAECASR
jgi:hypothetical protein